MRTLSHCLLGLLILTVSGLAQAASPSVRFSLGNVRGVKAGHNTEAFLGIPYAMPPVGHMRWKGPRPAKPWDGTLQATKFPSICPQKANFFSNVKNSAEFGKPVGDEDCLYLNIWRPENRTDKLPVVFWIHGGSNFKGTSSDPMYDGAFLAANANVIFVSVNYRLGLLGAISHPALRKGNKYDQSGNFVTLDLVTALDWVHENIETFGGDSANVTIMGQSAGCMNVWGLLQTPLSEGLFHKAVCSAGIPNAYPRWLAEQRTDDFIENLIVNADLVKDKKDAEKFLKTKNEAWLRKFLYERSTEDIVRAQAYIVPFQHFQDPAVFPHGLEGVLLGKFHRVPLILGATGDEATYMMGAPFFIHSDKEMWELIQNPPPDLRETDLVKDPGLYHAATSAGSLGMTMTLGNIYRTVKVFNKETYRYSFQWKETPSPWKEVFGAVHGMDAIFYLGNFITDRPNFAKFAWSDDNKASREALREKMNVYFRSFFWTGNPNSFVENKEDKWDGKMIFK